MLTGSDVTVGIRLPLKTAATHHVFAPPGNLVIENTKGEVNCTPSQTSASEARAGTRLCKV